MKKKIIGFSSSSNFPFRLPAENELNIFVQIRDKFDGILTFDICSIVVRNERNDDIQELEYANENLIGQIIISMTQEMNGFSSDAKMISPLGSQFSLQVIEMK